METWYLYATIEGNKKVELIGTSTFKATVIEPRVVFNKHELSNRLDIGWMYENKSEQGTK